MDCSGGANVLACAAVNAYVGVNDVFVGALRNSFYGASAGASAAAYAFIGYCMCHKIPPKFIRFQQRANFGVVLFKLYHKTFAL